MANCWSAHSSAKRRKVQVDHHPAPIITTTPTPLSAKQARNLNLAQQAQGTLPPPLPPLPPQAQGNYSDNDHQLLLDHLLPGETTSLSSHSDEDAPRSSSSHHHHQPRRTPQHSTTTRYFAPTQLDSDSQPASTRPPSPSAAASTRTDTDPETFQEASRSLAGTATPTGNKTKLGRGKRQRREKSAFLDPACFSSFVPTTGTNASHLRLPDSHSDSDAAALFCLAANETLIIHGSYLLTPIYGSSSILGSVLTAAPSSSSSSPSISLTSFLSSSSSSTSHQVFSPSSHPLPPLTALPSSSSLSPARPSTLTLPDGSTLPLDDDITSILLVQELNSQIEAVETVLKGAGMGCGNQMWEIELDGGGREGGDQWQGRGWRLITEPTPSLTSLRTLDSWETSLASFSGGARSDRAPSSRPGTSEQEREEAKDEDEEDESETVAGAERMVLLVEGPKRVGKSTFTKLLLNRLLSRYETVAYLDTDLGQPEFTTPGFVSLNVVQQPVLGPAFTHLSLPVASHFLGNTSPASDPSAYLAAISALLTTFNHDVEYPITDDHYPSAPRRRGAAAARSGVPTLGSNKIRDRVPLIINTQGWVKGLGADLLLKLKAEARPTHVVQFEAAVDEEGAAGGGGGGGWAGAAQDSMGAPNNEYRQQHRADPSYQVIRLAGAPSSPLDSKWSAADLRTLSFISYFHAMFPSTTTTSSSYASTHSNTFPSSWDFSAPLVARTPFAVDWTVAQRQVAGVHLLDSDVPYEQVLYALNGSVVALLTSQQPDQEEEEDGMDADPSTISQSNAFPLLHTPPSPLSTRSLGLALIRSIDPSSHTLHLLTPVHPSLLTSPLTLVKGAIDLPLPLQLDFNATELESARGVCGTEWKEVPYLTVEEGDQGRKKVRRNLMRRGQT